jgi:hypothetical protein
MTCALTATIQKIRNSNCYCGLDTVFNISEINIEVPEALIQQAAITVEVIFLRFPMGYWGCGENSCS